MNQFDSLYEIEQELYKIRMMTTISLRDIKNAEEKLNVMVMYNIERHQEYSFENLLKYVKILGKRLLLDGRPVESMTDIGTILKEKRTAAGLSVLSAFSQTQIQPKSIAKMESGKQYRKSTLAKYISYYNLRFTLDN
jgi:hypothetical protein